MCRTARAAPPGGRPLAMTLKWRSVRDPGRLGPPSALNSPLPADVAFAWASAAQAERYPLLPQERALLPAGAAEGRLVEFALGRGCARTALARLTGGTPAAPVLRSGSRMPLWPEGIVGSITHKVGLAAAAAARREAYRGVGLDLERVRRPGLGLLRRVLRPEELARLPSDEAARARWFTVVFSAKESVFKALNPYTGVFLGFHDASVELPGPVPEGAEGGSLRWRLHKACGPELPAGFVGEGAYTLSGELVLTGVWLPA